MAEKSKQSTASKTNPPPPPPSPPPTRTVREGAKAPKQVKTGKKK